MRKLAALLVAFVVPLAAGCGGEEGESALSETASKLGEIRSGELSLSLIAEGSETRVGFELQGPFELRDSGLPVAELAYTQIAAENEATVTFISTGDEAFVETDDGTYVLPEEQAARLRAAGGGLGGESDDESDEGLGALGLDDWLVEPEVSEGDTVDGAETDRISAELDVVEAANDLLALLEAFGGGDSARIEGQDAENLRSATEAASVEVLTGADDRLLRSLVVDLRLAADAPPELLEQLGPLGRAQFRLELGITNPNEPVTVEPPANAEPFPSTL